MHACSFRINKFTDKKKRIIEFSASWPNHNFRLISNSSWMIRFFLWFLHNFSLNQNLALVCLVCSSDYRHSVRNCNPMGGRNANKQSSSSCVIVTKNMLIQLLFMSFAASHSKRKRMSCSSINRIHNSFHVIYIWHMTG